MSYCACKHQDIILGSPIAETPSYACAQSNKYESNGVEDDKWCDDLGCVVLATVRRVGVCSLGQVVSEHGEDGGCGCDGCVMT